MTAQTATEAEAIEASNNAQAWVLCSVEDLIEKQKQTRKEKVMKKVWMTLLGLLVFLGACTSPQLAPEQVEWQLEVEAPGPFFAEGLMDAESEETTSLSPVAAGDLDATFSGDGLIDSSVQAGHDRALGMAVQSDGKVVLAGPTGQGNFGVLRYTSAGGFDNSFDADGIRVVDMGSSTDKATGMALQGDGKIVVVGEVMGAWGQDAAVLRLNPNGSLDASFSSDGKGYYDFNHYKDDHATSVAIAGSKIVVVGWVAQSSSSSLTDFVVMRLNADGSPDLSFNGSGVTRISFDGYPAQATEVTISNDKIIVVGHIKTAALSRFAVARLNSNGSLDTSFSSDGKTTFGFEDYLYCNGQLNEAYGVAVEPGLMLAPVGGADRKIIITGSTTACGDADFAVARLNPNGSFDTSFSTDGKRIIGDANPEVARVALATGGLNGWVSTPKKIVLVGYREGGASGANFKLVRLNWDGSNDNSFSFDSVVTTDFNGKDDRAYAAAIRGGKIIVAGEARAAGTNRYSGFYEFAAARYDY